VPTTGIVAAKRHKNAEGGNVPSIAKPSRLLTIKIATNSREAPIVFARAPFSIRIGYAASPPVDKLSVLVDADINTRVDTSLTWWVVNKLKRGL
jgi:hypothetical protein